ncbi:FAD-dependent oxidoreductase [Bordetella pertussis]|nr:FAD-dependent oxidoreductase [Bordetella pertussis]
MNTHKHARLTFLRRLEMVQQLIAHQVCVPEAARAYGVTAPTVRKWLGRFLAQGQAGLADASSRPTVSPRAIVPAKALAIVELRRKRLTQARIAQALGVSASTVSRVLARAGLSHLADLEPAEPVVRYEHQAPGDLLHIDIKKLGRIQRPGHRVTGNRRDTVEGAGWDFVFVAIDDHARVAFTDIHPDERFPSAVQFLKDAVAYYQRLGVTIQRLLTDNGSAFRSRAFAALCHELGIKHRFTRPYRPQTNGKAERFIQSALREWAYAHTYQNSQHRADAMKSWLHHYNWHRPHQGIGRAVPISRLNLDEYNLLTVHTYSAWPIEFHGSNTQMHWEPLEGDRYYGIPYESCLPQDIQNALVVGRAISSTPLAQASCRVTAPCIQMGESAGIAAHELVASSSRTAFSELASMKFI